MKKKGFTLIELLAVIIILAVIALIATPIVLNLIDNTKKNAALSSVDGYVNSINYKLQGNLLTQTEIEYGKYDVTKNELGVVHKGVGPTKGNYIVENNRVIKAEVCINGYSVKYENGISSLVEDVSYCGDFIEPAGVLLADLCNDSSIYENNTSFKIKKVEDLVCLSQKVNEGSTFEGKTIYLLNNIDFNDDASYTNANSQSEDINGNGEIEALKTELTTESGFNPIGTSSNAFAGTFDGYAFTISNLYINRSKTNNIGLFGYVNSSSALIKNINLDNVDIIGQYYVGGLIGILKLGTINQVKINGSVIGTARLGGLVGQLESGVINEVTINEIVIEGTSGSTYIGGLVGYVDLGTIESINLESIDVTVEGSSIGGLVGYLNSGTINEVIVNGNVTGNNRNVGGIAGFTYGKSSSKSKITSALANVNVIGESYTGGIIGTAQYTIVSAVVEDGTVTAESGFAGKGIGHATSCSTTIYTSSDVTLSETSDSTMSKDGTSFDATNSNNLEYYSTLLYNNNPIIETSTTGDINETGYVFDYYTNDLGQQDIHLVKVN